MRVLGVFSSRPHPLGSSASAPGIEPVPLDHRRVFILPTRHGYAFAGTLLIMLIGSINYNNSLGYVLTFLLGSMTLVSILHTHRNLNGIRVRPGRANPVFAGDVARLGVFLESREQPDRPAILLTHRQPKDTGRPDQVWRTDVPANSGRLLELELPAPERGLLRLGQITLATRYPFGLFRAWSHVDVATTCVVYPQPALPRPLPAAGAEQERERGGQGTGRDDFSGFREYVPGDSPRRIHWKAVAREQGVPVKIFTGAGATTLELRWEDTVGHEETRLSQLCRWVLDAEREVYRYALSLPGCNIAPGNGAEHCHACLTALAMHGKSDVRSRVTTLAP